MNDDFDPYDEDFESDRKKQFYLASLLQEIHNHFMLHCFFWFISSNCKTQQEALAYVDTILSGFKNTIKAVKYVRPNVNTGPEIQDSDYQRIMGEVLGNSEEVAEEEFDEALNAVVQSFRSTFYISISKMYKSREKDVMKNSLMDTLRKMNKKQ